MDLETGEVGNREPRVLEMGADGGGDVPPEVVAAQDRRRVGRGGVVGDARIGDRVERVAGDVGDRQVDQPRRRDGEGEPAPLESRDLLADGVDLRDRQPGAEQQPVQVALVLEADADRRQAGQRRASAREAGDHDVALADRTGLLEKDERGGDAALVGDRVGGLDDLDPQRLRRGAAVPDHDRAAMQPLAEDPLEGERDLQARLAGAEDDHLPVRVEPVAAPVDDQLVSLDRDHTLDRETGIAGGEACLGDPDGELSRTG